MKIYKNLSKSKQIRRKRGEHYFINVNGINYCKTCGCDEDDAFVGGLECYYGQKEGWKQEN